MPHSGDEPVEENLTVEEKMELIRTARNNLKNTLTIKGKTVGNDIRLYYMSMSDLYNTSDANAIASDIVNNKSGYVKGNKIVGNRSLLNSYSNTGNITTNANNVILTSNITSNIAMDTNSNISLNVSNITLAQSIGLTTNKIKSGTTILGITGNYETDLSEVQLIAANILGEDGGTSGGAHSG